MGKSAAGMPATPHTDREYEGELRAVRQSLLGMARRVQDMIGSSVRALVERDRDLARATIDEDWKVNRSEVETDELCMLILAKRQPMASDLRFVTLALKMVTDLERIGDLAVNICERAIDLADDPSVPIHDGIHRMTDLVRAMVEDAITAFVDGDPQLAQEVIERDNQVDDLYHAVFRDLLGRMTRDPGRLHGFVHVQSVAKWLERMADHATNLAELVVFMVKGKDIRHLGSRDEAL